MMKLRTTMATLWSQSPVSLIRLMRDWKSLVRLHFLYAAIESGLLESLETPCSKEELSRKLGVTRPELLDALLDVGLAVGELSCGGGRYRVKGRRSRSVMGRNGDVFAALIQANVSYYNSVYRHLAERLRGAPLSYDLETVGGVVARCAKLAEPYVRNFVRDSVAGRGAMRILDVGCGSGVYLRSAAEANPAVAGVGMDVDEEVVEQARRNLQEWGVSDRFKVVAGDVRVPPPAVTGTFDLITLYNVIYYFPAEERAGLFRTLRSKLSPSGALAIVSSVQGGGRDLAAANLNVATSSMVGCTPLPDLDEIAAQLKEGGFGHIQKSRLLPGSAFYGITAT